jgi:putative membrane protein
VIAAATMTAWDVVMDPGQTRAGSWVWEAGGAYFGVPLQNFMGWMVTTLTIYLLVGPRPLASLSRPAVA